MIGQYLPNNNETATVAFSQKILPTKQPLSASKQQIRHTYRFLSNTSNLGSRELAKTNTKKKQMETSSHLVNH
jgi:hypothetical protein